MAYTIDIIHIFHNICIYIYIYVYRYIAYTYAISLHQIHSNPPISPSKTSSPDPPQEPSFAICAMATGRCTFRSGTGLCKSGDVFLWGRIMLIRDFMYFLLQSQGEIYGEKSVVYAEIYGNVYSCFNLLKFDSW